MRTCAIVLVVLSVLLLGCDPRLSGKAKVNGQAVYLPHSSVRSQIARQTDRPVPVFLKFDGSYPASWPKEIRLPDDFHSYRGKQLQEQRLDAIGFHVVKYWGISHQSPEALEVFFKTQWKTAKWLVKEERASPGRELQGVTTHGQKQIVAVNSEKEIERRFVIIIYNDPNADGWTYFTGSYSYPIK
jgi:hypothetical protein